MYVFASNCTPADMCGMYQMWCAPFATLSIAWLQVHPPSFGYAAVQAAIFVLATSSTGVSQRNATSAANVAVSSVRGGLVNLTTAGNARGFATVTVDGRNKTIGATSAGGDGINTTIVEFISSIDPSVINPTESDPTEGVPAPPVVSPPDSTAPPGPAGEFQQRAWHLGADKLSTSCVSRMPLVFPAVQLSDLVILWVKRECI